ncbi:MAG: hypothetical protein EBR81_06610 [Proteobacteria bacterium]|nr:hypothetical protein [Pseudomonadota bacterium]
MPEKRWFPLEEISLKLKDESFVSFQSAFSTPKPILNMPVKIRRARRSRANQIVGKRLSVQSRVNKGVLRTRLGEAQ